MLDSDKSLFAKLVESTLEIYGKELSASMLDIYWLVLQRFEFEEIRKAFQSHLSNPDNGQFFPKPADVVRHIEGNSETRALQAWTKVERAIRCVGSYQSVVFDDPVIHAAIVEMGGWIELNRMNEDDLPFKKNEFEKRYRGYMTNPPVIHPKALAGLSEADCNEKKLPPPKPVVIGQRNLARLVYKNGAENSLTEIFRPALGSIKLLTKEKTS